MKLPGFAVALAAVWLMGCSMTPTSNNNPRTDALAGTWNCLAATVNGKSLPDATVKLLRLTLTRDRYKTEKGSDVLFDSAYTVDASKRPGQINMVGTEGDLAGKEAQG